MHLGKATPEVLQRHVLIVVLEHVEFIFQMFDALSLLLEFLYEAAFLSTKVTRRLRDGMVTNTSLGTLHYLYLRCGWKFTFHVLKMRGTELTSRTGAKREFT
jgi:hypothetical protein